MKFLGIRFWNGPTDDLCREMDAHGGALMVPSAPSLAQALREAREGAALLLEAHRRAAWAVVDGGYAALILRLLLRKRARRISGRQLIERLFADPELAVPMKARRVLWVVPNEEEQRRIAVFLESAGFSLSRNNFYAAPYYKLDTDFADTALIEKIEAERPEWVVLCIGGGRQEKLAHCVVRALRERRNGQSQEVEKSGCGDIGAHGDEARGGDFETSSPPDIRTSHRLPAVLCTGAAIAFFTGGQTNIPKWVDRVYLGWLWRIFEDPKRYGKRYFEAFWLLPWMLWRFRRELG